MKEKEHRNKYKVSVADYLFSILKKLEQIEKLTTEIMHENTK